MFVKLNVLAIRSATGQVDMVKNGKDMLFAFDKIESLETLRSVVYNSESKLVMQTDRHYYLKDSKEVVEELIYAAIRRNTKC